MSEPASELLARIVAQINAEGPLTFAEYMSIALYDPELGYFMCPDAAGGPGTSGESDFVTSPEISPLFGDLVARQIESVWVSTGRPEHFTLVEAGAGRGTLARSIIDAVSNQELASSLEYVPIEPSGEVASIDDLREPITGVILANEMLDNLAGHLLVRAADGWRELYVDTDGDGLGFVASEISLLDIEPVLDSPEGTVIVRSPLVSNWVRAAAERLRVGELILIDYADPPPDALLGGVRTFSRHKSGDNPLLAPGLCDITLPVNWDDVSEAASAAGLDCLPLASQRDWLIDLGIEAELDRIRDQEIEATASSDHLASIGFRDQRMRALALIDPEGLGGFRVFRGRRSN